MMLKKTNDHGSEHQTREEGPYPIIEDELDAVVGGASITEARPDVSVDRHARSNDDWRNPLLDFQVETATDM